MLKSHEKFHSANGKRQILVVDDEFINREILKNILQSDYEVLCAEDGREALQMIRDNKDELSLVLLDLMMPVMTGIQVIGELKADPQINHIPVIVLTSDQNAEIESLDLGALDFIPKPYPQAGVILARVRRTIELSEDREIIHSTERDPLTGLYNREYFYRYAEQFDQHHKDMEMDAIVVDINHFHMINERYGKDYGDGVLRRIGEKVREMVEDTGGIVCRREADTFLVYCPHGKDYQAILDNASIGLAGEEGASESRVRLRMGVYSDVDKSIDIERRFDRAKNAADTVKSSFTRNIAIYDNSLLESELYAEQLIEDFPHAIEQKQFLVYYQPKYDIRGEKPVLASAEALVRWKHPALGMISPGVFIPLFEENGLIQQLDQYVWEEAAEQAALWKEQYGSSIPVSVNISRIDFFNPGMVANIQDIMEAHHLAPDEFMLEVTESAYTDDAELIIETVKQLREIGFLIEMDDFGTGYSSLGMVSHMPFDALKLDMMFVRNAFNEHQDVRMLELIIDIAEYLTVPVIAEGVETQEQLAALKTMGCDLVQGYYFSPPVPADTFAGFLKERQMEPKVQSASIWDKDNRKEEPDMSRLDIQTALDNGLVSAYEERVEQVLKTSMTYSRIADALAADYFSIYYVDMDTEEFLEYSASGTYRELGVETGGHEFFATSRKNILRLIDPRDREMLLSTFTKENIQQALAANATFTMNYRLLLNEVPTWVSLKATRMRDEHDSHIVIGVNNIEAQMKRQQEYEQARKESVTYARIADALSRDYYSIYYVNAVTDEFIEYTSSSDYKDLHVEQNGKNFFDDCYRNVMRLVYPEDLEIALDVWDREKLLKGLEGGHTVSATYRLMFDGEPRYINCKVIRMEVEGDDDHIVIGVSNVDAQVRREQEHEQQLGNAMELANRDALTGVKSKHAYVDAEKDLDQRITDGEVDAFAVAVCDVNGLKQVNDTLGHKAGDRYIKDACMKICNTFKHSPVFRIGGDEFVVLLYGSDYERRGELTEQISQMNLQNRDLGGVVIACGLSDFIPGTDARVAAVFERADAAMYKNKSLLKK